jgi:hypothetical protein
MNRGAVRRVCLSSRSRAVGAWKRPRLPEKGQISPAAGSSRLRRSRVRRKEGVVLKSIKAMRVYEVVTLLISVFWLVGCSAPVRDWNSSSNRATMRSPLLADRATTKVLYVANSAEETVQRFAMDGATKALVAAEGRLGWCCPAVSKGEGRAADASCESCAWKMQVVRYEIVLLWRSLHSDAVAKDEMCRLDPL